MRRFLLSCLAAIGLVSTVASAGTPGVPPNDSLGGMFQLQTRSPFSPPGPWVTREQSGAFFEFTDTGWRLMYPDTFAPCDFVFGYVVDHDAAMPGPNTNAFLVNGCRNVTTNTYEVTLYNYNDKGGYSIFGNGNMVRWELDGEYVVTFYYSWTVPTPYPTTGRYILSRNPR